MNFITKFFYISLLLVCCCVFDICFLEAVRIELFIFNTEINFGIGVLVGSISVLLFIGSLIKSFFQALFKMFSRTNDQIDHVTINNLAKALVSEKAESIKFLNLVGGVQKFEMLRNAVILARKLNLPLKKTGIPEIDIYVLQDELKTCLDNKDLQGGLKLFQELENKYANNLPKIWEYILGTAVMLKKQSIKFSFDPRKYKYNLTPRMIEEYIVTTKLIDFQKEQDIRKRFKVIEGLYDEYPLNTHVYDEYLTLIVQNPNFYNFKKIKKIFCEIWTRKPDRSMARYVLMLNRNDAFEFAQEISASVDENNLERLWFLCEIAYAAHLQDRFKQLFDRILKTDTKENVLKYIIGLPSIDKLYPNVFKQIFGSVL